MDDWKPIETAPRDRTWFLARTAEGAVRYVHFDDSYDRYPISHNGECWSTPPIEWCAVSVPDLTAELRKVKAEWDAAQSFIENDADWKFSAKRRLQLFREQRKRAETAEAEVAHWENVAIARDAKIKAAEAEVARLTAQAREDAMQLLATSGQAQDALVEVATLRAELDAARGRVKRQTFPILGTKGAVVDLQLVADHGRQAYINHGQTVTRLAERGGLSWPELHAVLHNRRWQKMDETEATIACRGIEARYLAALEPDPAVVRMREALEWQTQQREEAMARRYMNAPEDPHVEALCERYGYGAVMDAASRLWARKDSIGAFYIGGCIGMKPEDEVRNALQGE